MPAANATDSQRLGPTSRKRRFKKSMMGSMGYDHNPIGGIAIIPCTGVANCNTPSMGIKEVLSENLRALMASRPALDTLPKITAKTFGRLSNGKLDRIRRAAVATDIDSVEQLAEAFGLEAWQLLKQPLGNASPNEKPPVAQLESARGKRWPFPSIDPVKVGNLSAADAEDLERAWLRIARNLEIDIEVDKPGKRVNA